MDEHESPGESTLQVLLGRVRLTNAQMHWDGTVGDHIVVPQSRHGLQALEDSVVLLTVAKRRWPACLADSPTVRFHARHARA